MAEKGRPTKYDKKYCQQAKLLATLGATDVQAAEMFGVSESTLYLWKIEHPEFSEALKQGKDLPDNEIEASLFKRAKGYTRKVERMGKNGPEMCEEDMPPDPTSMIFWLKNRRPDRWRDKQEHDHNVNYVPVLKIKQE